MPDSNKEILKRILGIDKDLDKIISGYEKKLVAQYKIILKEFKSQLAAIYERYGDNLTYQDAKIKKIIAGIKEQARDLNLTSKNIIETSIKDIFQNSYELTGAAINTTFKDLDIDFGSLSTDEIRTSILNPIDKINWKKIQTQNINKMIDGIKTEVTQGLLKGKGYTTIAKGISEVTGFSAGRSVRIARTETHRVTSEGRQIAYERTQQAADTLGLEIEREWISIRDGRSKERHHERMNGQHPNKDGYYIYPSGIKTKGPGLSGVAGEDIQCRCSEGIKIKGL